MDSESLLKQMKTTTHLSHGGSRIWRLPGYKGLSEGTKYSAGDVLPASGAGAHYTEAEKLLEGWKKKGFDS